MSVDGNLNWLLHKMFMIRDFEFCKKLIEQQMHQNLNQEYLFYVQVRMFPIINRIEIILTILFLSGIALGFNFARGRTLSRSAQKLSTDHRVWLKEFQQLQRNWENIVCIWFGITKYSDMGRNVQLRECWRWTFFPVGHSCLTNFVFSHSYLLHHQVQNG